MLAHLIGINNSNSPESNEPTRVREVFIDDLTQELNVYYSYAVTQYKLLFSFPVFSPICYRILSPSAAGWPVIILQTFYLQLSEPEVTVSLKCFLKSKNFIILYCMWLFLDILIVQSKDF